MPYRDDDAARTAVADARRRRSLPMLERIEIASPCSVPWDAMMGDERSRLCGKCNKHVFDLSNMTADEAERFLVDSHGVACVRYFQRADGTILLADCTIGRRRRATKVLAGAALAASLAGSALGYTLTRDPVSAAGDWTSTMGDVSVMGSTAPSDLPTESDTGAPAQSTPRRK